MSKIPVVVVGPHGKKLGKPVCDALLAAQEEFRLVGGVVRSLRALSDDVPGNPLITRRFPSLNVELCSELDQVVVFYAVKGDDLLAPLKDAVAERFRRHVIGSTAIPRTTSEVMEDFASNGKTIVVAPNFSEEAVVAGWLAEQAAWMLRSHDAGVHEIHHNRKADAPSGTATMIAESIARGRGLNANAVLYGSPVGDAALGWHNDVYVTSQRLGGVPGEHIATFAGPHGTLAITQRAYSSQGFAVGALRAIRWAASQPEPGLYGMRNVLGVA